jgi:hypothetical protein
MSMFVTRSTSPDSVLNTTPDTSVATLRAMRATKTNNSVSLLNHFMSISSVTADKYVGGRCTAEYAEAFYGKLNGNLYLN